VWEEKVFSSSFIYRAETSETCSQPEQYTNISTDAGPAVLQCSVRVSSTAIDASLQLAPQNITYTEN
jgi:hypothetical protein